MHQNDLLKTLCRTVEKDITEWHKCGITQCLHRFHQYLKLYMTVKNSPSTKDIKHRYDVWSQEKKNAQIVP